MNLNWYLKRCATKLKNIFRLEKVPLLVLISFFFLLVLLKYYLLAIFVLVTFFWLLYFRERSIYYLLILFLLSLFFSTNFFDTMNSVHNVLILIYSREFTHFDNILKSETDITAIPSIPKEVYYMGKLIDKHSLNNFNLSTKIKNNSLLFQRAIEVTWPVKLEIFSNYFFILDEESVEYEKCQKLDQLEEVILVYCP